MDAIADRATDIHELDIVQREKFLTESATPSWIDILQVLSSLVKYAMPFQHHPLTHCWHGCNDPLTCFSLHPQSDEVEAVILDEILEEANGTQKFAKSVNT